MFGLVTPVPTFTLCSLCVQAISIERTVIDVLGEMWSTMLLNSTATMCSIAGLLGICAGEKIVFALVRLINNQCKIVLIFFFFLNKNINNNKTTLVCLEIQRFAQRVWIS